MSDDRTAGACTHCAGTRFTRWEVPSGGGLSIKLLPLSFFEGGKLEVQACLSCGHVEWFVAPETLQMMQDRPAA